MQIDIRVAVMDSMLSRLADCADKSWAPVAERLLLGLERTVPAIGSLNERYPTQMLDWEAAG